MEIACPSCQSVYDIDPVALGPSGRRVRCTVCATEWLATAEMALGVAETPAVAAASPAVKGPRRVKWAKDKVKSRKPMGQGLISAGLALAVIVLLGAGLMARQTIVSVLPQTAGLFALVGLPVNLRGLDIRGVTPRVVEEDGARLLTIEGQIVNIDRAPRPVPRLRFAVLGDKGQELFTWTAQADRPTLQPGESLSFRRRLAAPPAEGTGVSVRFVTRGDIVAGLQ
jgi:predicted Zn finger-like uncharacterized protein